jgi:hypothetical protein
MGGNEQQMRVRVGSTGNDPERADRVRIVRAAEPGKPRTVALALGAATDSDLPMPDLEPGDRLRVFAELELTTDAPDPNHPGLIGHAYSYAPELEARLLLADDSERTEPEEGKAIGLGDQWRGRCSHERHHQLIRFADVSFDVPARGLPWSGPSWIVLTVAASHPEADPKDVVLVGENEKEPVVDQDVSGIRVVRYRPGPGEDKERHRQEELRRHSVPVAKEQVVVLSQKLEGLAIGDQLLVRGRLVTNAKSLGYPARISTGMFVASEPNDLEPKGHAQEVSTWKGHLSKENGCNCLPDEGATASEKFGVFRIEKDPGEHPVFVNLTATSSAPFNDPTVNNDHLPIEGGFLEVVRFPAVLG